MNKVYTAIIITYNLVIKAPKEYNRVMKSLDKVISSTFNTSYRNQ